MHPHLYLSDRQLADRFSTSRQTIWAWLRKDPTFPRPISLSPGCTRWKAEEIVNWERSKAGEVA